MEQRVGGRVRLTELERGGKIKINREWEREQKKYVSQHKKNREGREIDRQTKGREKIREFELTMYHHVLYYDL